RSKRDWSSDVCSSDLLSSPQTRSSRCSRWLQAESRRASSSFRDSQPKARSNRTTELEDDEALIVPAALQRRDVLAAEEILASERSEERRVGKEGRGVR